MRRGFAGVSVSCVLHQGYLVKMNQHLRTTKHMKSIASILGGRDCGVCSGQENSSRRRKRLSLKHQLLGLSFCDETISDLLMSSLCPNMYTKKLTKWAMHILFKPHNQCQEGLVMLLVSPSIGFSYKRMYVHAFVSCSKVFATTSEMELPVALQHSLPFAMHVTSKTCNLIGEYIHHVRMPRVC